MKKLSLRFTGALLGASLLAASGASLAESTHGYNAGGTGPVNATARVNINVTVPLLVLLRVGAAGTTINDVNFALAPTVGGIPTLTAPGSWDATAPTFTSTATNNGLTASAWTNASGGGKLTCSATAFAAASNLSDSSIQVASTTPIGGGLAHPGTTTGCGATTTLTRNTLQSSTWTYTLAAAAVSSATAGSYSQVVTYTAATL